MSEKGAPAPSKGGFITWEGRGVGSRCKGPPKINAWQRDCWNGIYLETICLRSLTRFIHSSFAKLPLSCVTFLELAISWL